MRIVVPHVGPLQEPVDVALRELAPHAERVDVSGSPTAYYELLSRLWAEGEGFLVVEHDIELTAEALREAEECDCPWGISPYVHPVAGAPGVGRPIVATLSLGCTRFSTELLREHPDAWNDATTPPQWHSHRWLGLDLRIAGVLMLAGVPPHGHSEVPHWRKWRPRELAELAASLALAERFAAVSPEARLEAERLRQALAEAKALERPLPIAPGIRRNNDLAAIRAAIARGEHLAYRPPAAKPL